MGKRGRVGLSARRWKCGPFWRGSQGRVIEWIGWKVEGESGGLLGLPLWVRVLASAVTGSRRLGRAWSAVVLPVRPVGWVMGVG